jgi:phosphoribosylamine--glycine ligase
MSIYITIISLHLSTSVSRAGDSDTGPNTGGMGAYSPAPVITPQMQEVVMRTIIEPTVKGMAAEGCRFVGVLYAGLMIDSQTGAPKLLEYNVRFGDPECQVSAAL